MFYSLSPSENNFHTFRFTFAKPGAIFRKEDMTIYSRVDYKETLGNRNGLSETDAFRVNTHYNCPITPPPTTTNSLTSTTTTTTTETSTITSTISTTITTPKPMTTDKIDTTTITSSPVIDTTTITSSPVIETTTITSSPVIDTTTITSSPVITSRPDSGKTTTNEPVTIKESTRTSSTRSAITREVNLTVTQRIYILCQLIKLLL